jgi:hypothetical protein
MRALTSIVVAALVAAGCAGGARRTADEARAEAYVECSKTAPCQAGFGCHGSGLCLPRCGDASDGPICAEGAVCQDDGTCGEACDEAHECSQAYTCRDSKCAYDPCGHPEFWPLALESKTLPVVVHYRHPAEAEVAAKSLGLVEHSWAFETTELGWDPPLPDGGRCGADERFDVFIWRTYRAGTADVFAENPDTAWDDQFAYLIVDPWGPYGGDILDGTICHELNHAIQARYDWHETPLFFEMTAQFVEDLVFDDDDNYRTLLADFQQRPDWAFDFDDEYETWYFYGTALYFFYLRDGVLDGDVRFVPDLWRACQNPAGENEPDFADALDAMLRERTGGRLTYLDSLVAFTRWRWYTGRRDDGHHFEEGASFPEQAEVRIDRRVAVGDPPARIEPGPMMLGVSYVTIARAAGGARTATVSLDLPAGPRWSVQAVPGIAEGSDGDTLDASAGPVTLDFGTLPERTLVVLALPPDAAGLDPESRTDARYPFTITVAAP